MITVSINPDCIAKFKQGEISAKLYRQCLDSGILVCDLKLSGNGVMIIALQSCD